MFSGIYDRNERDGRGVGMGGHEERVLDHQDAEGVHGHQDAEGVCGHQHEEGVHGHQHAEGQGGQEGAQDEEVYMRAPPVQGQGKLCSVWSSQLNAS